jgi:hypothetical protein
MMMGNYETILESEGQDPEKKEADLKNALGTRCAKDNLRYS